MDHSKIKNTLEELLRHMGVSFQDVVHKEGKDSKHVRFSVDSLESDLLIGPAGEHLNALNYVVRRIISKGGDPATEVKFSVDVNGHYEKAEEAVKTNARLMGDKARSSKADVELPPMSSYERMLIHSLLEGEEGIKTESRGEGVARHIVIKYISLS